MFEPKLTVGVIITFGIVVATGTVLFVVPPLPNWLLALSPQQYAAPLAVAQAVLRSPDDPGVIEVRVILVTVLPLNTPLVFTATGVLRCVVVPSPSSPAVFLPQQYAAPLAIAHADPPA